MEPEPEPMPMPHKPSWTRVSGVDLDAAAGPAALGDARAARATAAQALARNSSASEREARAAFEQQRQVSERETADTEAELQRVQLELSSLVPPAAEVDPRALAAVTGRRGTGQMVSNARQRERVLTLRGAQSGWLWKLAGGARIGNPWQKRWFILESNKLTYYDSELCGTLKGAVDLSSCNGVHAATPAYVDDAERRYEIEVELPKRTYHFRCENA
jgi:hypothetical protein